MIGILLLHLGLTASIPSLLLFGLSVFNVLVHSVSNRIQTVQHQMVVRQVFHSLDDQP